MNNVDLLDAVAKIVSARISQQDILTDDLPTLIASVTEMLEDIHTPRVTGDGCSANWPNDPALL